MQATETEKDLSPTEAAFRQDVHPATIGRWIRLGAKARDGSHIRLKATRRPGGWRIAPRDLDDFLARLTDAALGEPAGPESVGAEPATIIMPAGRRRELDRVDREIERLGL